MQSETNLQRFHFFSTFGTGCFEFTNHTWWKRGPCFWLVNSVYQRFNITSVHGWIFSKNFLVQMCFYNKRFKKWVIRKRYICSLKCHFCSSLNLFYHVVLLLPRSIFKMAASLPDLWTVLNNHLVTVFFLKLMPL